MATNSPRVRDNINRSKAHNAGYAGGKILRKRMARLAARKLGHETIIAEMRRRTKSIPESAFKLPGSCVNERRCIDLASGLPPLIRWPNQCKRISNG